MRYEDVAVDVAARLRLGEPGVLVVPVPPGEHPAVADAIARHTPVRVTTLADMPLDPRLPLLVAGLGAAETRGAALPELNARRDRLRTAGVSLVLLLSRGEIADLQRLAGDLASAATFLSAAPFEPDPGVDEATARAALLQHLRTRYGRLNLQGFVRSEVEDAAWSIEDVYQELRATRVDGGGVGLDGARSVEEWMAVARAESGERRRVRATHVTVLGHPGTGKTFLLRSLALRANAADRLILDRPVAVLFSFAALWREGGTEDLWDRVVDSLLEEGLAIAHVLRRAADAGRLMVLFDGLDEVGDEAVRRRAAESVGRLLRQFPHLLVISTSRMAGYGESRLPGAQLSLAPLDDADIERFLTSWCALYERDRVGTEAARRAGAEEGQRLARDVLAHPEVAALARNPLLLTVLALVHRAGVRLPDHRVELYEHATRVLVERWNRVRGLGSTGASAPIKAADAVRLLGPVALEGVRTGIAVYTEGQLHERVARAIRSGNLRGVGSPDEAIAVFRDALGLLVEQGPGLYAFLHLTLAEYFAARELVRTSELERLAAEPREVFLPHWREVILLAAGELGVNRADDERLSVLVHRVVESAAKRRGRPSPTVPSLLGGLLADDPGLSGDDAQALIDALVPRWWFDRRYTANGSQVVFMESFNQSFRILRGPHAARIRTALTRHFVETTSARTLESLAQSPPLGISLLRVVLSMAKLDARPLNRRCLSDRRSAHALHGAHAAAGTGASQDGSLAVRLRVDRAVDDGVRRNVPQTRLIVIAGDMTEPLARFRPYPWRSFFPMRNDGDDVWIVATFPVEDLPEGTYALNAFFDIPETPPTR